jgi:hypothetical protein
LALATGVPGDDPTDDDPPDAVETSSSAMTAAAAQADVSSGRHSTSVLERGTNENKAENYRGRGHRHEITTVLKNQCSNINKITLGKVMP